jgi:hypothetical protein
MVAHKFIARAIKRPGAFTAKAKRAGMSVAAFAKKVLKKSSRASTRTKRQANLAQTLRKLGKRRSKKQVGPPRVGMRTVKGRRGKRITIKRPSPRNV